MFTVYSADLIVQTRVSEFQKVRLLMRFSPQPFQDSYWCKLNDTYPSTKHNILINRTNQI